MTECDRKIFRKKVAENLVMKIGAGESAGMNLEKGVFNSALQEAERRGVVKRWDNPAFQRLYKNRLRSVFRNLGSDSILQMIRSGKIQAHKLAFMSHQDMQPEKWDALLEAKRHEMRVCMNHRSMRIQITSNAENANQQDAVTTSYKLEVQMNL